LAVGSDENILKTKTLTGAL